MTTDITELAQKRNAAISRLSRVFNHCSQTELDALSFAVHVMNELVEALEKAQQVDEELCKLLPPGAEYMDPPDGGSVTPLEQVSRMIADYRQRIAELREWNAGLAQESFERQQRIAELESRTVKLPSDNAAESESPENDASAWFDEGWNARGKADKEALTAAGIKWEAE